MLISLEQANLEPLKKISKLTDRAKSNTGGQMLVNSASKNCNKLSQE